MSSAAVPAQAGEAPAPLSTRPLAILQSTKMRVLAVITDGITLNPEP